MKRVILLFMLVETCTTGFSQLLRPVPDNLFGDNVDSDRSIKSSVWLPRLNVGLSAMSYGRNPVTKLLEVKPLSAIIFGIGYLHYKEVEGLPFNDLGISLAYLQLTDKAGSGVGIYGTYNTGQIGLLNIGGHYDFAMKQFFFDTGVTWHF